VSELQEVKKFLVKVCFIILPFSVYLFGIAIIDPFNYFGVSHIIDNKYKEQSSAKFHYTLWKSVEFKKSPSDYVLFGDSRMAAIDTVSVRNITGKPFYNFSFGGGTIPEMIDAFWFADKHANLKEVYFGIGFINFNKVQSMNRFIESSSMINNPMLYLINKIVLKSAAYNVFIKLSGEEVDVERPSLSRDIFWTATLGDPTTALLRRFEYPDAFIIELKKVVKYCEDNDIKMTFIIPPIHVDLQNKFSEFGLLEQKNVFNSELRNLGKVIDFAFVNGFTENRDNFSDPYHPNTKGTSIFVNEVWRHNNNREYWQN
jgi:hypothetical protein